MKDHLDRLLSLCASSIHALRMLRAHGLQDKQIHVLASMTCVSINDAVCISSVVGIYHRSGSGSYRKADVEAATGSYLPPGHPPYEVLAGKADDRLLKSIMTNSRHVLSMHLPKLEKHRSRS